MIKLTCILLLLFSASLLTQRAECEEAPPSWKTFPISKYVDYVSKESFATMKKVATAKPCRTIRIKDTQSADRKLGNVPLSFDKVKIEDDFWGPRIRTNAAETLLSQYKNLVDTGRIPAFKLDWKPGIEPKPHCYWDSDVAKWVEGACYSISVSPDPKAEAIIDEVVDLIVSAQQPDGYLNVFFTAVKPELRWTNLRDHHELYCAGHLMEAAVAHYRATGKRKFLDAMCRYADYIDSVFGVEPGKKRGYGGHPEIELALVKLYEATGNERYLKLSDYFVEERGNLPHYFDIEAIERGEKIKVIEEADRQQADRYNFSQANAPVREQAKVAGHAVRAMYFYAGAADIAGINHDDSLSTALKRLLDSLTSKQMYITGGIGSSAKNEGFTTDYDLPNRTAYAETCAATGLVFWCHRMLRYDLDSRYADIMERAMYNGCISGISLDGNRYFYENPLASDGSHHRVDWFGCSCCPPNIFRLIASLGGYIYSHTDNDAIVHLYVQSKAQLELGGKAVTIRQETNYPWDGNVALTVGVEKPSTFAVRLRIPGWCDDFQARLNGKPLSETVVENGYLRVEREWRDGDCIELNLPMIVKRMYAHPNVKEDAGMVALQRGPIVYCFEEADNPVLPHSIVLPTDAVLKDKFEPNLLGGVISVQAEALLVDDKDWGESLYRDAPPAMNPITIKAIPYYAWDNRSPGWMSVWLRR